MTRWTSVRDGVLFLAGLALLGHETLIVADPREVLIGVAVVLLGLPTSLLADRKFLGIRSITAAPEQQDPPPTSPPTAPPTPPPVEAPEPRS